MPDVSLDAGDAAELLQFLSDWLAHTQDHLDASLEGFVGNRAYHIRQLRSDLDRFTFLLGGNDGESLFQPGQRYPHSDGQGPISVLIFWKIRAAVSRV